MKILYAEDERQLSMAVAEILKMEGYEVVKAYDGAAAWESIQSEYYDAVILDIMMPKMSGIQVLELMRYHEIYTPVLMLTAKSTIEDRVEGLAVGADDYLSKPFAVKELIARLQSMIRRSIQYKNSILKYGNILLDCNTNELKSDKGSLRLSGKESELLALFMRQESGIFTIDEINELLWKCEQDENTVILYISYLKNKLSQIHADVQIQQDEKGYFLRKEW